MRYNKKLTPMPFSTLYAASLALVLGVGCGKKEEQIPNSKNSGTKQPVKQRVKQRVRGTR